MASNIALETTNNEYIIRIDKTIKKETVEALIERIRLEYLLEKADFQENILSLGDEIKATWWQNNKDNILKMVENHEKSSH